MKKGSSNISFSCRPVEEKDIFRLMELYQLSTKNPDKDLLFLDYKSLLRAINSKDQIWMAAQTNEITMQANEVAVQTNEMLTQTNKRLIGVISLLIEPVHLLCKIVRIYADLSLENRWEIQKELLLLSMEKVEAVADIIYTTTHSLTYNQLKLTEEVGFKVLGFFPISPSVTTTAINGVTAYFFKDVLEKKRYSSFLLHPIIRPFYEIIQKECNLPDGRCLPVSDLPSSVVLEGELIPDLEIVSAPRFVSRRFHHLKEKNLLSNNFYPFQEPNALITDPDAKIEIFLGIYPEIRYASIIEERLEEAVNPAELYKMVSFMLQQRNISYIEVIVDAGDVTSIEYMAQAGFLPCAYFPCLKKHGNFRRDFVVLGKSFEKINYSHIKPRQPYMNFISQYLKLEAAMLTSDMRK